MLHYGTMANYTRDAYGSRMEAIFKETRMFAAVRENYLSDDDFATLQQMLMRQPQANFPPILVFLAVRFQQFQQ